MKLIIILFLFSAVSFSQSNNFNEKINEHLKLFRNEMSENDKLFIDFDYDSKEINLENNGIILNNNIDPKKIKSKYNYYLIKFLILNVEDKITLRIINFKVKKINNKKMEFINLMNGKSYDYKLGNVSD